MVKPLALSSGIAVIAKITFWKPANTYLWVDMMPGHNARAGLPVSNGVDSPSWQKWDLANNLHIANMCHNREVSPVGPFESQRLGLSLSKHYHHFVQTQATGSSIYLFDDILQLGYRCRC
tara:strand:- start:221 stop:580 length:360 start_codon:yes stop_codon:yes gene_type:complete